MKNMSTKMTTTATTVMKATMISQARLRQAATAGQWRQHRFRAMNTDVHTWVFGRNEDATAQVAATFHQQERTMSRFDAASELSRLNQSPDRQVTVSPALFAPLSVAFWAAEATDGIFDPTLLAPLQAAGYDRSFELIVERAAFRWTVAPEHGSHARRAASPAGILAPGHAAAGDADRCAARWVWASTWAAWAKAGRWTGPPTC
jgi:hypothetical protein